MGNEVSTSENCSELNMKNTLDSNFLKTHIGISAVDYSGILDSSNKIAYDNINDQIALITCSGDIQVIKSKFNKIYKQTDYAGKVDFFDFTTDGLGLIIIYSNRLIEYFDIIQWKKKVILPADWTEEKIVCLSMSRHYLTNYFFIGLSNGYVRIFNSQTCQLLLYTITPLNCSIKVYSDTLLSIIPIDISPSLLLITYKQNGVFLMDMNTHKVLLHYTPGKSCDISAISILPQTPYFIVAHGHHLYLYTYVSAVPISLDIPTAIYKQKQYGISNIFILPNFTTSLFTMITTVNIDKHPEMSSPHVIGIQTICVSSSLPDISSTITEPYFYTFERDVNIISTYCCSYLSEKQQELPNSLYILEGKNMNSSPPYLFKIYNCSQIQSKEIITNTNKEIHNQEIEINSPFVNRNEISVQNINISSVLDFFTYSFPSMSEHVYTTIYTYIQPSKEYSNTYIFNCYKNGQIHIYQRFYNNYYSYQYKMSMDVTTYSSLVTPVVTSIQCISVNDNIHICISFYTGEIQVYEWNMKDLPVLLYFSDYHLSQPLSLFLTSEYVYFVNTFGSIIEHNIKDNTIVENTIENYDIHDIDSNSIYPTTVTFYKNNYIILGFNNGGLYIYNIKTKEIEYNKIIWKGQEDNYLYAKELILVDKNQDLYMNDYNLQCNHEEKEDDDDCDIDTIYLLSDSCMVRFDIHSVTQPMPIVFSSSLISSHAVNTPEGTLLLLVFQDLSICIYDYINSCYAYRTYIPVDKRITTYKDIYHMMTTLSKPSQENTIKNDSSISSDVNDIVQSDELNEDTIQGDLLQEGYKLYMDIYGYIYIYVGTGETFIYSIFKEDPQPNELLNKENVIHQCVSIHNFQINYLPFVCLLLQSLSTQYYRLSSSTALFKYIFKNYIQYYNTYINKNEIDDQNNDNQKIEIKEIRNKNQIFSDSIIEEEKHILDLFIEINKHDIYDHDLMLYNERQKAWNREKEEIYKRQQQEQNSIDSEKRWNELQERMNESRRLLHERGEKLNEVVTATQKLEDDSLEFYNMAHELCKQQEKQSKLFGLF